LPARLPDDELMKRKKLQIQELRRKKKRAHDILRDLDKHRCRKCKRVIPVLAIKKNIVILYCKICKRNTIVREKMPKELVPKRYF